MEEKTTRLIQIVANSRERTANVFPLPPGMLACAGAPVEKRLPTLFDFAETPMGMEMTA